MSRVDVQRTHDDMYMGAMLMLMVMVMLIFVSGVRCLVMERRQPCWIGSEHVCIACGHRDADIVDVHEDETAAVGGPT